MKEAYPVPYGVGMVRPSFPPVSSLAFRGLTLGLSLALLGCSPPSGDPEATSGSEPSATQKRRVIENDPIALDVRNEEQSMVEAILGEITGLASFAASSGEGAEVTVKRVAADPAQYEIRINLSTPVETTLTLDPAEGSIWNPSRYAPFTAQLLKALALKPAAAETLLDATTLLTALSEPTATKLKAENERLSAHLTQYPLDAEGYAEAAVLVGTLGLRENSGFFWDTRALCNRATALLAFSEALRGEDAPTTPSARLGRLLVGLLEDTKRESAGWIDELAGNAASLPALTPWINAARLRNTRDWRTLADPGKATLLERIEFLRAVSESISPEIAAERLEGAAEEPVADWSRILLQYDFTVGTGHAIARKALGVEFKEIAALFPEAAKETGSPEALLRALAVEPQGMATQGEVRVIDDGTWAHFSQRHLLHVAQRVHLFLADKWGVREEAVEFRNTMRQFLAPLSFFPLLEHLWHGARPSAEAQQAAAALATEHPEWIADGAWAAADKLNPAFPKMTQWFSNGLPIGTAYSFYTRLSALPQVSHASLAEIEALYEIAPVHYGVGRRYYELKSGGQPTPALYQSIMKPFLDYNVYAMTAYARLVENNPAKYAEVIEAAARLEPYYYIRLARYYMRNGLKPQAITAFEAAMEHEANSIAVANISKPFIFYYYEQGNTERALAIAKMAAEVYSHKGLEAMAELSEKMGNLDVAEEHFLKIVERYEDAGGLYLFYQRQAGGNAQSRYTEKMNAITAKLFPEGLKKVGRGDFSGVPAAGVLIEDESNLLRRNGLQQGDIVTALDGVRTDSFPQYCFVRSLKETPEMELIIYRDGSYKTIPANAPNRRFNCSMATYSADR